MQPAFALMVNWKQETQRLQCEAYASYFLWKHPRTRWYAKLFAICIAGYLFSPIQLIPNFIPVIGFLDDLLILCLGVKLLHRITPPGVLAECRQSANEAAMRRQEEIRSVTSAVASIAVMAFWLLGAITASALIAKYLPR